jgi:hypothetical protein
MAGGLAALFLVAPAYAFQPAPALVPAFTAEEAIARQEVALERSLGIGCRREEGEIVVCAPLNRGGIPFPEELGERKRLIAGEPASAGDALSAGTTGCTDRHAGCGGYVDFLRTGKVLYKIGKHLLGKDD